MDAIRGSPDNSRLDAPVDVNKMPLKQTAADELERDQPMVAPALEKATTDSSDTGTVRPQRREVDAVIGLQIDK